MRTDLTIRTGDGVDRDVAVVAPAGTTLAEARPALQAALATTVPGWVGGRRLDDTAVFGRPPLVDGAVLASSPAPPSRSAATSLDLVGGPDAGNGLALTRRDVTAGRAPDCELVLTDPQVSRHHALFAPGSGGVTVHDLGSTNGTVIDGTAATAPTVLSPGCVVRVGDSFLALADNPGAPAATRPAPAGGLVVARTPRPVHTPATRVIVAPPEPARPAPMPRLHVVATLLPAAIGGALAWLTGSWQFLAFAALSPAIGLSAALGARRHHRRDDRHSAVDHRQAVARADAEIAVGARQEARRRRRELPDPATLLRVARIPTTRLWQRGRADPDLLSVRVGLAAQPSEFVVERNGVRSPATTLPDVPASVDLAAGALAVVAPRLVRERLARWLVAQLAVLVSPADLEIALLVPPDDDTWRWARWLPHLRHRVPTCAPATPAEDVATLVRDRRAMPSNSWTGPRLLLVAHAATADARAAVAPDAGVHALVLAEHESDLPAWCTQVVRAIDETGHRVEIRPAAGRVLDVVADQVGVSWAETLARALAPLRDEHSGAAADNTVDCRLIELVGLPAGSADALRVHWRDSGGSASSVIGLGVDGPVSLDLDRDGPHALVAGSTGSGKSELLQTLVAGLALDHPPSEMTFLLVDYKGGAAFAECARLPHTIGLVTDLDEHLTRRVLASLDSEVRRREALLAEVGARDLAELRALHKSGTPARLVVVVDEFAVLAEELPDFVPGLVGIARRGRSLGLHLVLATQRPAGVVSPEIRANTALRICLRVTSAAESLDVIDGPEASTIARSTPGRAFVRSGATTTAVQIARVGAPAALEPGDAIRVLPLDGWRRPPDRPDHGADTDLQRIVAATVDAARGLSQPHRPWLPHPLPLCALPPTSTVTGVPIGLLDQPDRQRQVPLTLDLGAGEVVVIAGRTRSGRSTTLLTVARATADRFSPDDVHVYGIDATGDGLAQLRSLPHTGTVVTVTDGIDLAARLVERLTDLLAHRRGCAGARPPAVLVLLDGWDQFVAATEDRDGGRTAERLLGLLQSAPGAAATVVLTGGRSVLAPRVVSHASTRLVLALADPGEYAVAGVEARAVPADSAPGRGVRSGDGVVFQIAVAPTSGLDRTEAEPPIGSLQLRALPRRVHLADLPRRRGLVTLGVGGDVAAAVCVDLRSGSGRLLVAGPPRSGRTTLLRTVTEQVSSAGLVVAAPVRSPLVAHSRRAGARVLAPTDHDLDLPQTGLLVVDDAEAFTDTPVGDALAAWVRADADGRAAVVAGRSDTLALTFRGLAAEVRHARCGVLLQPGPVDADLLGIYVPRARAVPLPGRGLLVPDPSWGLGGDPIPLQVAVA